MLFIDIPPLASAEVTNGRVSTIGTPGTFPLPSRRPTDAIAPQTSSLLLMLAASSAAQSGPSRAPVGPIVDQSP
jgi:hypothetical protein